MMRNLREFPEVENVLRSMYERMAFKMQFGETGELSPWKQTNKQNHKLPNKQNPQNQTKNLNPTKTIKPIKQNEKKKKSPPAKRA